MRFVMHPRGEVDLVRVEPRGAVADRERPEFRDVERLAVRALDALGGAKASRLRLGFADLAGLLAALGLAYDSPEARATAAAIAALTGGAAEAESGRIDELDDQVRRISGEVRRGGRAGKARGLT